MLTLGLSLSPQTALVSVSRLSLPYLSSKASLSLFIACPFSVTFRLEILRWRSLSSFYTIEVVMTGLAVSLSPVSWQTRRTWSGSESSADSWRPSGLAVD